MEINSCKVLGGKPNGKRQLVGCRCRGVDIKILADPEEIGWRTLNGLIWLRIGTSGRSSEHGMELFISIKCGDVLK